jgi:hypothetical protein
MTPVVELKAFLLMTLASLLQLGVTLGIYAVMGGALYLLLGWLLHV